MYTYSYKYTFVYLLYKVSVSQNNTLYLSIIPYKTRKTKNITVHGCTYVQYFKEDVSPNFIKYSFFIKLLILVSLKEPKNTPTIATPTIHTRNLFSEFINFKPLPLPSKLQSFKHILILDMSFQ